MIRIEKDSRLVPEKAVDRALAYFGPSGLGLSILSNDDCCARFEGGGGYVFIQTSDMDAGSKVVVESREWDYHIKKFMGDIE